MQDSEIGTKRDGCPFCSVSDRLVLAENELALAFYDGYPVSDGHALVISRRHAAHYFELTTEEKHRVWDLVDEVVLLLKETHHPDGFNIGFNVQEAGGQTVFHTHIHIIPRYEGDVSDPRGGIRHVIQDKGHY
ncbi:MAG: HIT family protein [Chitinophagaceae bacterium]|nr:MAG: HIT family protein [Chitinophagaceae bacterium]